MLINASYHDHQEYIWFKGGHLDHLKIIFTLYNDGGGDAYHKDLLVNASYYNHQEYI